MENLFLNYIIFLFFRQDVTLIKRRRNDNVRFCQKKEGTATGGSCTFFWVRRVHAL